MLGADASASSGGGAALTVAPRGRAALHWPDASRARAAHVQFAGATRPSCDALRLDAVGSFAVELDQTGAAAAGALDDKMVAQVLRNCIGSSRKENTGLRTKSSSFLVQRNF